jgi:hypothetical protein
VCAWCVCMVCVWVRLTTRRLERPLRAVALCDPHTHYSACTITNEPHKQRSSERVMAVCAGWASWVWVGWLPDSVRVCVCLLCCVWLCGGRRERGARSFFFIHVARTKSTTEQNRTLFFTKVGNESCKLTFLSIFDCFLQFLYLKMLVLLIFLINFLTAVNALPRQGKGTPWFHDVCPCRPGVTVRPPPVHSCQRRCAKLCCAKWLADLAAT